MTCSVPPIAPEACSLAGDDRPGREAARERIVVSCLGPVALELCNWFPRLSLDADALGNILPQYKVYRDKIEGLMKGPFRDPGHVVIIDRHKIGAAFILAILEAKPLRLPAGSSPESEGELIANAVLAFRTAVRILRAFNIAEHRSNKNAIKFMHWQGKFALPPPRDPKTVYPHHAARALHHWHRAGSPNLPVLANWLFVLEQYFDAQGQT